MKNQKWLISGNISDVNSEQLNQNIWGPGKYRFRNAGKRTYIIITQPLSYPKITEMIDFRKHFSSN
jgi:hypothetical protein